MATNRSEYEFLETLFKDSERKIDTLSEKMERNHRELVEQLHEVELKVESHVRAFSIMKWAASTGGLLGIISVCKDWLPFIQHKP